MFCFNVKHVKIHAPVWLQNGVRAVSQKLSNLMCSMKDIKPSATPLRRMQTLSNLHTQPGKLRIVKDDVRGGFTIKNMPAAPVSENKDSLTSLKIARPHLIAENKSAQSENSAAPSSSVMTDISRSAPCSEPVISAKLMNMLHSYQGITDSAFFGSNKMPTDWARQQIYNAEENMFPLVLEAFNHKYKLDIVYTDNLFDISDLIENPAWNGRQQFIYQGENHSVFVDLYKNEKGNASIITIDTLKGGGENCVESKMAAHFNARDIPEGKLSLISFKTDAQKNYLGCKYFNMHFAKTAAKDNAITDMHETHIKHAKQNEIAALNDKKMGVHRAKPPHPHTFVSAEHSPELLNARYYKHSHSSQRLNALSDERKGEKIFKGLNVIDRSNNFRVQKTDLMYEKDKKTGKLLKVTEKKITFSNSLDHFRQKRIAEAVEFMKPFAAERLI